MTSIPESERLIDLTDDGDQAASVADLLNAAGPYRAEIPHEFIEHVEHMAETKGISVDEVVAQIFQSWFTGTPIKD